MRKSRKSFSTKDTEISLNRENNRLKPREKFIYQEEAGVV